MESSKNLFFTHAHRLSTLKYPICSRIGMAIVVILLLLLSGCATYPAKIDMPQIDLKNTSDSVIRDQTKSTMLDVEESQVKPPPRSKVRDVEVGKEDLQGIASQVRQTSPKSTSGRAKAAEGAEEAEGLMLNFDNADIYEVIQVIAATLNLNYIIDPQVKGVVNIHSGTKIPTEQLLPVFKKILHMNGLDIRNEGDYDYIYVARKTATQIINSPDGVADLKDSSQFVIQVIPLSHIASVEVVKLVEPYLSAQGSVDELADQNTLLISDYESKVVDILRIIGKIDISSLASLHIKIVRVDNAPVYDLRDELTEIFIALKINRNDYEGISVVPLERINSLMLVSNNEQQLANGVDWIRELDVEQTQDRDNIYIYNVRNSVASELSELINELLAEEPSTKSSDSSTKKTTDSLSSKADPTSSADKAKKTKKTTKSTSGSLSGGSKPSSSLRFVGEPVVFADDDRNVILIRALPADYSRIVKLLERLDNLPRQVLVEVMIAEIELKNELELGVEWLLSNTKSPFGVQFAAVGKPSFNTFPSGFSYSFDYGDLDGFLQTLASKSNFAILSSPQVLVLNNETATVNVGKQVPIVTTVTENISALSQVDKTVQYMDTGVILEVTPQINYNGIILLDVSQTVSQAQANTTSDISSPEISKRELTTKLAVKGGQSILMGGMIDKNNSTIQSGVPFLMDIPILGNLFKYQKDTARKTELIIIITPFVIESEDVLDQYVRDFEEKLAKLRPTLHAPMSANPRIDWQ
ncbi:MAG: type II secretion system secretin GspD [Pseudomonadota bacterium]